MPVSKKKLILECFRKMDINMLHVLLDDSRTYQEATKEMFLQKLELAFEDFRKTGDTALTSHSGICISESCPNKGCKGYAFIGNLSSRYLTLIFQERKNTIEDIYRCAEMKPDDCELPGVGSVDLCIDKNEEADFYPDVDYLIKDQQCMQASDELEQYLDVIIDKEIYLPWLAKHAELFDSFEFPEFTYTQFKRFYWLYANFYQLKTDLYDNEVAKEAVDTFSYSENDKEIRLLIWLCKYEKIGTSVFHLHDDDGRIMHSGDEAFFITGGFRVSVADFADTIRFQHLFDKYYWDKLEKYRTNTRFQKENNKAYESDISLTYHLLKRGMIGKQITLRYR